MAPRPGSDDFLEDDAGGLAYYFDDLKSQMKKLKRSIHELSKASASDKSSKQKSAEKCLKETQEAVSLFQSSMNQADSDERKQYEHDFSRVKRNLDKYKKELDGIKSNKSVSQASKDELLNDKKESSSSDRKRDRKKRRNRDEDDNDDNDQQQTQVQKGDQYTKEITDLQQKNLDKLQELVELNDDTIQIGQRAAAKLKEQTEKLQKIQQEVDEIGSGLKRAKREMNSLYRNLVCSRVIIIIVIVVLLLAVVAIVLRSVLEAFGIRVFDENSIISSIKNIVKK